MRIVHLTHNFPRWPGDPSGNFLLTLAQAQVALGHEVTIVAPHAAGALEHETRDGIRVVRFRYGSDADETLAYTGVMHEQVRRSWRARWRLLVFLRAMRRVAVAAARERGADVLHAHWWFPAGLAAWPGRLPAALVVTSHGTDLFMLRSIRALRPLGRAVLRRARAVTTVSRALALEVAALGVPVAGVRVLPMPMDLALLGASPAPDASRDADHVLFVGRLSAQKGADDLLRALALLVAQRPLVRLTIVGAGAEDAALRELADALDITGRVTFLGALAPAQVAAEYRRASVLAVPSSTGRRGEEEGFGLVAAEAMAAGLPVVVTSTGGLTDIVTEGQTGLLVPAREPRAMAAALARVLGDASFARALATRARAEVLARFTPQIVADAYCALYADVAAQRIDAAVRTRE